MTNIEKRLEEFDEKFGEHLNIDPEVGQSSLQLDIKDFITSSIKQAVAEERAKSRGKAKGYVKCKFPVYYRSVYSRDCSRNETEEEKSTEMIKLSDVMNCLSPKKN